MQPLAIVPTYMRNIKDLELTIKCITSLRMTAPQADIYIVDDNSPSSKAYESLRTQQYHVGFDIVSNRENSGFAKTVNRGLALARDEGRDAVLVNADIEFFEKGWLDTMMNTAAATGAYVVGGLLLYPNGFIQHAGIYYSVIHRWFDHRYRLAPGNLPAAKQGVVCPVTGALQLIRNESLNLIGLYDEDFTMGYEDVDYCLRVFENGRLCLYDPEVRAIHYESAFGGSKPEGASILAMKHLGLDFSQYVPSMLEV